MKISDVGEFSLIELIIFSPLFIIDANAPLKQSPLPTGSIAFTWIGLKNLSKSQITDFRSRVIPDEDEKAILTCRKTLEGEEAVKLKVENGTICGSKRFSAKYKVPIDDRQFVNKEKNNDWVNLEKLGEMTDGLSGADTASIANTAVSLVIHEFLDSHPDVKEIEKTSIEAKVTMKHFEDAVKKVREQKDLKMGEKLVASYYR